MKKLLTLILLFIACINLNAHSLLMNLMDNEDNTITVAGEFTTGELAIGALVRLESLATGEVLYKKRLPDSSELIIDIPKEPYQVVLDGGPNHQVVKDGIAPINGFSKESIKKASNNVNLSTTRAFSNQWSNPTIVLFILAFILILLTMYFSMKNTNKILKQIKETNNQ